MLLNVIRQERAADRQLKHILVNIGKLRWIWANIVHSAAGMIKLQASLLILRLNAASPRMSISDRINASKRNVLVFARHSDILLG